MTAPGSGEGDFKLAGAYVELSIKDDGLETQVEEAKKKVEDTPPAEIPTKIRPPDEDPLKQWKPDPVDVPTQATNPIDAAWLSKVNSSIKSTAAEAVNIPATPDTEEYRAELRAKLDELAAVTVQDIPANLADADVYKARVEELAKSVSEEVQTALRVGVDQESLDRAAAQIEAEAKAIENAAQIRLKVSEDTSGAGPAASRAGSSGGSNAPGFGALVAGGLALGSGAVGGLTLAAIPAIFTAIGVEATKSSPQVTQAFGSMEASARQALQSGFQPFVPELVAIAGQAKDTVTGLEPSFQQAASAAAPMLQTLSTGLLTAVRDGVQGSVPILQSLGPEATAISDDFGKAEQGIVGMLKNIDTHEAAQGFELLGTDVQDLLPAVGQLITTIAPLGNAILGVLGPALRDTGDEISVLRPLFQALGAVVQYLGPEIAFVAGPLLAASAASKLLTGSWTDLTGAGSKVLGVFTNYDQTLTTLANKIGITTAAQNAETKEALEAEAAHLRLVASVDAEAAVAAKDALATDASAAAKLAFSDAADKAAASEAAAAVAEEAFGAAAEGASFAMGPLGIALGVIGLALAPLALNADKTTTSTDNLAGSLQKLEQAAADQHSLANLFQSDPNAEQQLQLLQKYGVTLQDLADANNGDAAAQKKVADAAKEASDAIDQKVAADQRAQQASYGAADSISDAAGATTDMADANKKATDALNADTAAQTIAHQTAKDAQSQYEATTAAQAASAQSTALNTQQQAAATSAAQALGLSTDSVANAFQHLIATNPKDSVAQLTQAFVADQVAADAAVTSISTGFKQADQAVTQAQESLSNANYSYQQSLQGVASAQHSYAQSQQAIVTAQQGVVNAQQQLQQAVENVATAEGNLNKAEVSEQQARVNLNQAYVQAAEDLRALELQMNDQVESEEAAKLKLFEQQQTSAAAGVTATNAQQIASEQATTANEAQIQAALDLISAQNSLADTLNTGANLRQTVAQAEQAGVDGAPGVIAAQQALQNAQDQVTSSAQALTKAQEGVVTAQQGVVTAEQGVANAYYSEQQAALAVSNAEHGVKQATDGVTQAKQALQTAEDNASRSLDITTAAGQRNYGTLQNLAQALNNLYGPQEANNQLIQDTANLFGISTNAAQGMLNKLGLLTANPYTIDVKAVASVDLGALENQLHISGTNINLKADGGYISGPGGPRDDQVPAMLSNGEYVVNAAATQKHRGLLESLNANRYANGGLVEENVAFGVLGINYQDGIDAMDVVGMPHPPGLPPYVAPTAIPAGVIGVPASRAANEAAVQAVFANYGWGSGSEWDAAVQLIMMESGFNNVAQNPTSTAYGIFQFLNNTWGGYGISKTSDPTTQAIGGARYIQARYGDPINALTHEHAYHWYENGGYLMPGATLAANGTGQKEMVLPPSMSDTLERVDRAVQSGGAGDTHNYHITQLPGESGYQLAIRVSANTRFASRSGR